MKAAQINSYGDASVITIATDAAKPVPGPGEVVVAVHAASVNPFDRKVRQGIVRAVAELSFPATLGGDFAGTVEAVGEGVTTYKPGDEVYGQTNPLGSRGSFAEFVAVKTTSAAPKPKNLTFAQAAAVPLAAVSAYQAIVETIKLQAGQTILIHGGAGGIGSFAVQLAKHFGAAVIATANSTSQSYVRSLGADKVIDYETQDFVAQVHDVDAIYDTVGGETYIRSLQVLKRGGIIVTMAGPADEAQAAEHGVTAVAQFTKMTTARLQKVAELCEQGALTVTVDKTFPLEKTADAQEYLHSGKHQGKVVIVVK